MSDTIPYSVLVGAGGAAVLVILLASHWLLGLQIPDRPHLEQRPGLWRLMGPPGVKLAFAIEPVIPSWLIARDRQWLTRAGLQGSLGPADLTAARLAVSMALTTAALVLMPLVDTDPWAEPAGWTLFWSTCLVWAGFCLPGAWLRHRSRVRLQAVSKALPFVLDIVTLAVEAGSNLTGALQYAVAKGPRGPLFEEISRVLSDVRAGRSRAQALKGLSERLAMPAVTSWVSAMISAERQGSSLGPVLRAQAEQRRQERFQAAETLAMRAPVKMLFPMLVFIFPCTFVLLLFPVAVRLFGEGLIK